MPNQKKLPNVIFETSWEVCNKVGGIYTVLSTRAKTLKEQFEDQLIFIGPDLLDKTDNELFTENKRLYANWRKAALQQGLKVRIGRWNIPGTPVAVLVDFQPFFEAKDQIYAQAWELFQVDSLHAYGDYDEASMFSYAAGRFVEIVVSEFLQQQNIIYQAHEWMSGLGMLFLQHACPNVRTIFTTHATSIGRSIAGNNKQLYEYFDGYNGDQMAAELNMEAKHSIEKQSAHRADCFTTVSDFTDRECRQLLDKAADVVLPNGFELDFVPKGSAFTAKRKTARKLLLKVAGALIGEALNEETLIISTSGRNDFRCKGFDVYLESMRLLNEELRGGSQKVLSLIEVPCWVYGARPDLQERLQSPGAKESRFDGALPTPMISHDLYNLNEDRILCLMKDLGLDNRADNNVKVILIPCYLDGHDGIFDMHYYDLLAANDLTLYPSYYEPWGYTPLESVAFKTPCVTTDLSGFGQWVNSVLGKSGNLTDGVRVLHRDDRNYHECAEEMCHCVVEYLNANKAERDKMRRNAAKFADKAQWKHFVTYYYQAYDFALNQSHKK
ncbi:glycosyltransferase [Alloprevotella sp. OH1205_COT-284]|uniref:glycosyltransferase n=1 Tax=Alloprevotella sp. OH1205_COT-284 TaxID=2491043 RepID=UPI000F5FB442|nr:glycosyltransferase [Alloprevotella sp. OH1205_COT-284]RRD79328.1 glycosyltransferase [Alloprevotella sp. OH1205_COT-284]